MRPAMASSIAGHGHLVVAADRQVVVRLALTRPVDEKVAIPRSRNSSSSRKNSSLVESSPGTSSTSGGRSVARGAAQVADDPAAVERHLDALAVRVEVRVGLLQAATAWSARRAARRGPTIQTNLPKW